MSANQLSASLDRLGYAATCALAAVRFSQTHKTTEQALYDDRLATYSKSGAYAGVATGVRA